VLRVWLAGIAGRKPPQWVGALALLLELIGLWLALGARIQLGFFSWAEKDGVRQQILVRSGFYRHIRHPTFSGILLALFAWP
jgi:protein-S-isoprenylcysteine O-methyltransferase Ste14